MVMGKKFEEFKSYIIREITESVKHVIQTEIHSIVKSYKDQLEKVTSTAEMVQQHVSNLKRENSFLWDKVKVYRQEFDSRCDESKQYSRRLYLRVKNINESDNENSEVVIESIWKLFDEANVVIADACIDLVQHVSKTSESVVVCFTTFRHRNTSVVTGKH